MRCITQCALAVSSVFGATHALRNITEDTYFYGLSQPVYPSPNGTGSGDWAESYAKARAMVARMTLEEKANFTISIPTGEDKLTSCQGRIAPIERLGFPGMCLADAGNGLRFGELTSTWPSGISVATSWNKELSLQRAIGLGNEFAKKSLNVIFGPVVGPLGRTATGGRNWEGLGYDPWLAGALVRETVKGIQGAGVIASLKHFIGNEQETRRSTSSMLGDNAEDPDTLQAISVNVDDKTLHELYLWPFVDALEEGVANIMCSYNRLNNSYGCQNSHLLNGILKTELGFQGFVLTDWGAQHSGVANAEACMDSAALPEGGNYETSLWGKNLTLAVQNGTLPEHRLDDMVTRVLAPYYKLGQDQRVKQPGPRPAISQVKPTF
ncbi:beta-glucosidase M [Fusarium albosuccineum]|uniref:Beta-glucosidase cel3A n=1 Tax=Fusarium albosuccineum TaxID=1237068 RepID=A0A8H4LLG6_9HYPO|nr:beta-glucosidase M [Fusarium albosuccineum]